MQTYLQSIVEAPLRAPFMGPCLRWLQKGHPDSEADNIPILDEQGQTNVSGVYIVGDLTGVPLLKMAVSSGARCVRTLAHAHGLRNQDSGNGTRNSPFPLLIVGLGASGMAAAREAERQNICFEVLEATQPMATIQNFPFQKPIFLEPSHMEFEPGLELKGETREELLSEMQSMSTGFPRRQFRLAGLQREGQLLKVWDENQNELFAQKIILATGRSGSPRQLGVPGEELDCVQHRFMDPHSFKGHSVAIVGGGDSAAEAAIELAQQNCTVHLIHRGSDFPRLKLENRNTLFELQAQDRICIHTQSRVTRIHPQSIEMEPDQSIDCEYKLVLIGAQPPDAFLRRLGIALSSDWDSKKIVSLLATLLAFSLFYLWKTGRFGGGGLPTPPGLPEWFILNPSAFYTLLYTFIVLVFSVARIKRRNTGYIRKQTFLLALIQLVPLCILPLLVLPGLDSMGHLPAWIKTHILLLDSQTAVTTANSWRAYGLILAWPLFPFNWLTPEPSAFWLILGGLQTFVLIPWAVLRWGKGAYCGFICSCGALAETLGDSMRTKSPHGPVWKKLENWGQIILLAMTIITLMHWLQWIMPAPWEWLVKLESSLLKGYLIVVDLVLASILGVGLYGFLGGRFWCRFFCPLAAFMHWITRYSQFRIFSRKERCISCGVCSRVCQQGIDVMAYASRGQPMDDVQCVRCSACVTDCPTDVLALGSLTSKGPLLEHDTQPASNKGTQKNS